MSFEKKKIQAETLSEYLSSIRQKLNLSVKEVADKTGIKPKFLENLEAGSFSSLPPYVYVIGFLKQLALLYNVEPELLVKQYKKEMGIYAQVIKKREESRGWLKTYFGKLVITPKYLSLGAGLAFVCATVIYIVWQVLAINKSPSLEVFEPVNNQVIKDSFVNIRGRTDPGLILTVNGQSIFVDSQGNFKAQLGVAFGPKDLAFIVKNKFDKQAEKIISITGQSGAVAGALGGKLQLKLEFLGNVTLTYSLDQATVVSQSFQAGDTKILSGSGKIVISTSDAGLTRATLNGQAMGLLGRPKEQLANIPFFADSAGINSGNKP